MKRILEDLERTINKSTIEEFRNFLNCFPNISKWMIISDYCFNDPKRPNNCISFIIYPYTVDLNTIQYKINQLAKKDLKHSRTISQEFCDFYQKGTFYSINFIIEHKNCFAHSLSIDSIRILINQYLRLLDTWIKNQPHKKDYYEKIKRNMRQILIQTERKTFNRKLFIQIVTTTFLASYLTYLLIKETKVEVISWFSDADKIINSFNGIAYNLYEIINHTLCVYKIGEDYHHPKIVLLSSDADIFYDSMIRLADYICGFVSEFDLTDYPKSYA